MTRKIGFALLWIGFSLYAFTLAPSSQPDTLDLIIQLSTGQWDTINPLIVTLFNLMGIWPMIYACLALIDGCGQKIPAWPFITASFGVGAFALLPYLALRENNPTFEHSKTALLRLLDSPWTGRLLTVATLALLSYGLLNPALNGSLGTHWQDFIAQWKTSQFIHVMSLDFCVLCAVASPLIKDDMNKRNLHNPTLFWTAAAIPLLGVLFYLSVRPPLPDTETASDGQTATTS
ncbi:MAG: DUF2834 domain-containing protein [Phormidesmis sp.]